MGIKNIKTTHLICATSFLTFSTVIYVLVGVYGLDQYDCIDIYTQHTRFSESEQNINISNISECRLCRRNVFNSPYISSTTSDIMSIYLIMTVIINQYCVLIGMGCLWVGNFKGELSFTSNMLIIIISLRVLNIWKNRYNLADREAEKQTIFCWTYSVYG